MQKLITIIGGYGQMGLLFTKLWQQQGFNVQSLDKDDWDNASTILQNSDLVVICVPINTTLNIINQVGIHLKTSTILADFTSVKTEPIEAMLKVHTGAVLGLHPMFGPTIENPDKQVVINCGGRGDYQWVINSISQMGFMVTDMDAKTHDTAMDFIQGIEHFSTFVLGSFLKANNQLPDNLFSLASPIYQTKLALMGRIFDQDASLYADIIASDKTRLDKIEEYSKYFSNWIAKLQLAKRDEFIDEFIATRKWMGEFTHHSQIATDEFLENFTHKYTKKIT